jgi:CRP/FNR family transcriptional regulator, cyclic AMP receptor protein
MAMYNVTGYIVMTTTSDHSLINIRGRVARVLLEHAADGASGRPRVSQRDIAATVGADWGMVHMSLKSMQDEGVIRIDRHRLIINKELLQKVARTMA